MSDDLLLHIQRLQYEDRAAAERLVLAFIGEVFPDLNGVGVELRPQAVSLNSFNGVLTLAGGKRLFFKTHAESDTVIDEYYNAQMLEEAGYPIIKPLYQSTRAGKQLLIYDMIEDPSVFDLAWAIEKGTSDAFEALSAAQNREDDRLFATYLRTMEPQVADDASRSPIHQLFYHRLAGGRLERYYGSAGEIKLPGQCMSLAEVRQSRWVINGRKYLCSLNDLIDDALRLLRPDQPGPAVTGHGDAHNGNVFYREQGGMPSLLYFDPAFAGRHHPLLDLAKPLFHNVFAMWMYFPQNVEKELRTSLRRRKQVFEVRHDYSLPEIRRMFLGSKVDRVLIPLLQELLERGMLRTDWRRFLKAALFCCPFLTLNLADTERFSPEITLLGLAMSVEMGADGEGERSVIDLTLDDVERVLAIQGRPPSDRWY